MHPIERLRHVARAGDVDASLLAEEAAIALGGLAFEPRALVPATRRLLEFHPSCAPLWWVCAELLAAEEPGEVAYELANRLAQDPTSDQLAAALPGAATLLTSGGAVLLAGLVERPDLTVRLVAPVQDLRYQLRRLDQAVDACGFTEDEMDEALEGVSLALVEAEAVGPSGVVLARPAAALARAAVAAGVEIWVVAGEGRVLPGPLFEALRARVGSDRHPGARTGISRRRVDSDFDAELDGEDPEELERRAELGERFVELGSVAVILGPEGPERPEVALAHLRCPVPAELLAGSTGR
jgi:hypothetical protein